MRGKAGGSLVAVSVSFMCAVFVAQGLFTISRQGHCCVIRRLATQGLVGSSDD